MRTLLSELLETSMFSGLISKWYIPLVWAYCIADNIYLITEPTDFSVTFLEYTALSI